MYSSPPCPNLLIGVSGSIQCTSITNYLVEFRQVFAGQIRVIMTDAATKMVEPNTVFLYADLPIFSNFWDHHGEVKAPHIQLGRWADLFVVLPASANTIGKAANGIADDLLSTTIIAYEKPIVFAPAMNPTMWANHAVKRNILRLKEDGHRIIPPIEGVSVTTGKWDIGLGAPSPIEVLQHMEQVHMQSLRAGYWEDATRELPVTPSVRKTKKLLAQKFKLEVTESTERSKGI
jgi:phosphopantothenoylcysteine decarboxylase / phosphopantothenate---cysteine ligase